MGVTDTFTRANNYLSQTLQIQLQDKDRGLLKRAGKRRFLQAVRLTFEQNLPHYARYSVLLSTLWDLTPTKTPGTKYRNPHTQKALDESKALDERLKWLIEQDD